MKRLFNNQRGVTLIELLAALTLISLVFGGITYVVIQQYQAQHMFQQASTDRTNLQATVAEMKRHIENAKELNENGANKIDLITAEGDKITYEITDGILIENRESSGKRELLHNVELLKTNGSIVDLKVQGEEKPIQMSQRKMVVVMAGEEDVKEPEEEYDWSEPDANYTITCLPGKFEFPPNTDFSEAVKRKDIVCPLGTGTLQTAQNKDIILNMGTIEIKTNKLEINNETNLHIINGSLVTSAPIQLKHKSGFFVQNFLYAPNNIQLDSVQSNLKSGKLFTNNLNLGSQTYVDITGPIKATNLIELGSGSGSHTASSLKATYLEAKQIKLGSQTEVIVDSTINITNQVSLQSANSKLSSNKLLVGDLLLSSNTIVNVKDLINAQGNIELHSSNSSLVSKDIFAKELHVRSGIKMEVEGNVNISNLIKLYSSNAELKAKNIYSNTIKIQHGGRVISAGDIISKGGFTTENNSVVIAQKFETMETKLGQNSSITANSINTGSVTLGQNVIITSNSDITSNGTITFNQNSKVYAKQDVRTINIIFNNTWADGALLSVDGDLYFQNIQDVRENRVNVNGKMIQN